MTEVIPRWGMPEVDFVETDADKIKASIITGYETASGRVLADGDPVRLFLLAIADVIIRQRSLINTSAQQNLLTYAQGKYLDALGALLSVSRLPASAAVTTIRFTLSEALGNPYTIPAGTEVTNGVVTFATDEEITIASGVVVGEVSATCTTAGEVGNGYLAGQLSALVSPLTFVQSAVNISTTAGGAEIEDDARYAERIRLAPNAFSVAGPYKAYIFHAKSASSAIVDVSVTSPTPGEVDVYPLMEDGELPSQEVLDLVQDHLDDETVRPLTDYVRVMAPAAVQYQINLKYWINRDDLYRSQQIRTDVEEAVERYRIWQQSRIARDITPARLIQYVMAAGASRIDAESLLPAAFVQVAEGQVAQCTGVTVSYEGYKDE